MYLSVYAPLVLWIGVIFLLSSPKGSMSETSLIFGPLLRYFFPDMSDAARQLVHGYIRKCAHFTEYAILALITIRSILTVGWVNRGGVVYLLPLLLVAAVACADEFNQSFESSRTGSIWDVGLDILGGLTATALGWIVVSRSRQRKLREG